MRPDDIVRFLPVGELFEKASEIFARQKKELEVLLPGIEIQHVGSSSVPGLIGKLDVDIQVRTTEQQFPAAFAALQKRYQAKHPEIWDKGFATFCNNDQHLIDIMVTVIGSKYDIFHKMRDRLTADDSLRERYNDIKRLYDGKTYGEYKKAKVGFFVEAGGKRLFKN